MLTHLDYIDRETTATRLTSILNDPALRLLFREYLRETVCEENLSFYLDVVEFDKNFRAIDVNRPDAVRETLAAAYGLYNAFLAPGSPCELNIDHTLRQDMASRMTRAVAKDDNSMYASLKDVAALFERAQQQVFKLMAGVSTLYQQICQDRLHLTCLYRILSLSLRDRLDILKWQAINPVTKTGTLLFRTEQEMSSSGWSLHLPVFERLLYFMGCRYFLLHHVFLWLSYAVPLSVMII